MIGALTIAPEGILSLKIKKPNIEAIIGSPRGTDAIAVGEKYFNA